MALGKGDGTFSPLIPFPAQFGAFDPSTVLAVGDFNSDGFPDLAWASSDRQTGAGSLFILKGRGDGTFTTTGQPIVTTSQFQSIRGIAVGRLTANKTLDIAYTFGYSQSGVSTGIGTLLGNGDGTFKTAPTWTFPSFYDSGEALTIADFNGDGKNDIGVDVPASGFTVLLENGDGTIAGVQNFAALTRQTLSYPMPSDRRISAITLVDLNLDGLPDVLITNFLGVTRLINVPVPTITPGSLSWKRQLANTPLNITVKNTLTKPVLIGSFLQFDPNSSFPTPFTISGTTCAAPLNPGASCTVTVKNTPNDNGGSIGALAITVNGDLVDNIGLDLGLTPN